MLLCIHKNPFSFGNATKPNHLGSWRPFFAFPIVLLRQDKTVEKISSTRPNVASQWGRLRLPRFTRLRREKNTNIQRLCDQLNNTTGLLDLLLGITAEVAGTDDEGDLGETALAEDLGVAEGQEVDDGGSVGLLAAQVGVTLLGGDEGPEL
jgi:hypothetical protein